MFEKQLADAKASQSPLLKVVKFFATPEDGSITAFGKVVKETMTPAEIAELAAEIDKA